MASEVYAIVQHERGRFITLIRDGYIPGTYSDVVFTERGNLTDVSLKAAEFIEDAKAKRRDQLIDQAERN